MRPLPGSALLVSLGLLLVGVASPSMARDRHGPAVPAPGDDAPSLCSDPQSCIEQLAAATVVNQSFAANDTTVQVTTFVWSARSFSRSADLYMISQYVRSKIGKSTTKNWQTYIQSTLQSPDASALPDPVASSIVPQNSNCSTQIVNTSTTSFGGSLGLTTAGPEVGSSTSNSWGHQTWTSCTSLEVVQGAKPRSTDWDYVLQDLSYYDETFLMTQQWIWEIPWSSLADAQSGIAFQVLATVYINDDVEVTGTFDVSVPAPFDAFSIPAPTLSGASPSTVEAGTVFTLSGTNLYPTGITDLFIAGNAVDPALWFPVEDGKNQQIIVITPDIAPGQSLPIDVITPGGVATGVSIEVTP